MLAERETNFCQSPQAMVSLRTVTDCNFFDFQTDEKERIFSTSKRMDYEIPLSSPRSWTETPPCCVSVQERGLLRSIQWSSGMCQKILLRTSPRSRSHPPSENPPTNEAPTFSFSPPLRKSSYKRVHVFVQLGRGQIGPHHRVESHRLEPGKYQIFKFSRGGYYGNCTAYQNPYTRRHISGDVCDKCYESVWYCVFVCGTVYLCVSIFKFTRG